MEKIKLGAVILCAQGNRYWGIIQEFFEKEKLPDRAGFL